MASNDCIMNCGNPIFYPSHGVCKNCYSSIRIWQKKKSIGSASTLSRLPRW
jgi:hypothetical protein